jgi:hypothetical protein
VIVGFVLVLCIVVIAVLVGWLMQKILAPVFGHPVLAVGRAADKGHFAGLLLLLQVSFLYYLKAFSWAGEPMSRTNLGWIVSLQRRFTPEGVAKRLETWRQMLARRWSEEDDDVIRGPAACALRNTLRETLWRDMLGFIPVYTLVLGFGAWFGTAELHWQWLNRTYGGIPLWVLLPISAAVADYFEDFCHLQYLYLYEHGRKPSFALTLISFGMTAVKFTAFLAAAAICVAAVANATWNVALLGDRTGWRGTVALMLSAISGIAIVIIPVSAAIYRFFASRKKSRAKTTTVGTTPSAEASE